MAASLSGLFMRGSSYYLRIVLPKNHPLRPKYKNGCFVQTLGQCSHLEAVRRGGLKRAEILWAYHADSVAPASSPRLNSAPPVPHALPMSLRTVFERWSKAAERSTDSLASCERALRLYETHTNDIPIAALTRVAGDDFRAQLLQLSQTTKTARDRLNWIKGLLNFASDDLAVIPKNPWHGIDIKSKVTTPRQPWTSEYLAKLFDHPIWRHGQLPADKKAGQDAAYWIPLLALYTGARCSELCQLRVIDINREKQIPTITFTDEGESQRIKTNAGKRTIPIHSELVRLGFLNYVDSQHSINLWPALPFRKEKPGGYFSQWFGTLRDQLEIPDAIVFHSFRHTTRSNLVITEVREPIIDKILGHETSGSVGAKTYTHIPIHTLQKAIERIPVPTKLKPIYTLRTHQTKG